MQLTISLHTFGKWPTKDGLQRVPQILIKNEHGNKVQWYLKCNNRNLLKDVYTFNPYKFCYLGKNGLYCANIKYDETGLHTTATRLRYKLKKFLNLPIACPYSQTDIKDVILTS